MTRRARRLAVLVAALLVGGCGVPDDDVPQALEADDVPFSLLATSTTTTTTAPSPPPVVDEMARIYLVDNTSGRLVEVLRPVPAPATVRLALQKLLEGPTEEELARGLSSSIAASTELRGVEHPAPGIVAVDLSDLSGIAGEGQRVALAQVVFSATAVADVTGVLFKFDGQPSEAPNAEGESTTEPLGRDDFAVFEPDAGAPAPPEG